MSSKTSVLSFDEWYSEAKKLNDDGFSAKDFYEAGQQSKQTEIDELQKRVKKLELISFDSELHFDAAKEHIDHLQEKIDAALKNISFEQWSDEYGDFQTPTYNLIKILKGEETK